MGALNDFWPGRRGSTLVHNGLADRTAPRAQSGDGAAAIPPLGMVRNPHRIALAALITMAACTRPELRSTISTSGDHFFDSTWPNDARTINGRPDMQGFPQADQDDLINEYMIEVEALDGFGTNAPVYIPMDQRPAYLPSPEETTHPESPILLMDIDRNSPERGRLVPLAFRYQTESTDWYRPHLLSARPVWGFPLRPRTTYAVILKTGLFVEVDSSPISDQLLEALVDRRIPTSDVAFSVEFTTQDPVGEMARFSHRIVHDLSDQTLDQVLPRFNQTDAFSAYEGTMWVPQWQHGTKPYFASGGGFEFDADGMPQLAGWERVNFTLSVPENQTMPDEGWPVVIYAHGTGGNNRGFASRSDSLRPAHVFAEAGMMGFGISLPLHGDRGTGIDPALVSFNFLNPESARSCFRQGALDQLYLARLLSNQSHAFELPDGTIVRNNPDRLAYMGHSHGGLVGAIAAPFFGESVQGVFLSGAGGGLSISVINRDAGDFDIQGILQSTLDFGPHDDLVTSHPVIGVVQTLAEATDPINYAPYWNDREPFWPTAPQSVLMTEGLDDAQTPPQAAEALAAAGRLPLIAPAARVPIAHRIIGGGTDAAPVQQNQAAWSGSRVTSGLAQYANEGHFVVFNRPEAAALYQTFLYTAVEGHGPWIQELQ